MWNEALNELIKQLNTFLRRKQTQKGVMYLEKGDLKGQSFYSLDSQVEKFSSEQRFTM